MAPSRWATRSYGNRRVNIINNRIAFAFLLMLPSATIAVAAEKPNVVLMLSGNLTWSLDLSNKQGTA
jgi:hypothetical protein